MEQEFVQIVNILFFFSGAMESYFDSIANKNHEERQERLSNTNQRWFSTVEERGYT